MKYRPVSSSKCSQSRNHRYYREAQHLPLPGPFLTLLCVCLSPLPTPQCHRLCSVVLPFENVSPAEPHSIQPGGAGLFPLAECVGIRPCGFISRVVLLTPEQCPMVWMYPSPPNGHFFCSQLWAIINITAISIHV